MVPLTKRLELELKKWSVFDLRTLSKYGATPTYAKTIVKRWMKTRKIIRITKGLYTFHEDPMIIASHITSPSYLGLWSALRFHEITTQLPQQLFVLVSKYRKSIEFKSTEIRFVQTKFLWGYQKYNFRGFEIFVSNIEKTIVDGLYLHLLPLEQIWSAAKRADVMVLESYALKTGQKSIIKRTGYLLQHACDHFSETLHQIPAKKTIFLDILRPSNGPIDPIWKLKINVRLEDDIY